MMKDLEKQKIETSNQYVWDLWAHRPPRQPENQKNNRWTKTAGVKQHLKRKRQLSRDEFIEDDGDYWGAEVFSAYYDCFCRIWGWDGTAKNPEKGVADLQKLLQAQSHMKWCNRAPYDPHLQFAVGVAYLSGWLTSINSNEPLLWFSRSAAQEYPQGLLAMGYLYEKGLGGCQNDPVEMLSYYRRAANLGGAPAMYRLAYIALELKLEDRDNTLSLLTQAAPEYRPAKVLLAKEFPDVAYSRKYRKLYSDDWDDIAEESIPVVELKNRQEMKKLVRMDEDEFAELEDEFEPIVEPTPVPVWGVNSDPDEVYPSEDDTWEDDMWEDDMRVPQVPETKEPAVTLDPELEEIFDRFFGDKTNTKTEASAPEPYWRRDTVILPSPEELLEPEEYTAKKTHEAAFDSQETEERRKTVDSSVQQLLREFREEVREEFRDFKKQYQKDQEQGRAEHKKLQKTTEEIYKDTRHIAKGVVENKELLISLDISVRVLQSSLQGMWSELKKTEEKFHKELDELKKQTQNQLNSIPREELENAEKFMAMIFLGDWREPSRLSNESCDALVAAHVLMKAAENMGVKNYAGIIITAVWALENECRRRFFHRYISYLKKQKLPIPEILYKNGELEFTLGKLYKITQTPEFESFARNLLISEVAKRDAVPYINRLKGQSPEKVTFAFTDYHIRGGVKNGFTRVVGDIAFKYRNKAAHAENLTHAEANECYDMLGITEAHQDMNSVTGALKALLWLTAPLDEFCK